jgi:hypothetical protein
LLSFAQREQRKGFLYGVFMAEPELNFIAPHPACLPARTACESENKPHTTDVQTTLADESKFAEMCAGLNGEMPLLLTATPIFIIHKPPLIISSSLLLPQEVNRVEMVSQRREFMFAGC